MKFIIAMDSFKDCAGSMEVGEAVKAGILDVFPKAETCVLPIADGGEGTVEALTLGLGGKIVETPVKGPLGKEVNARYGLLPDKTAVIEMASASGLELVPQNLRNPLHTSTYGTGQLIAHALDHNVNKIIIGIGGSATNDAGMGMLRALGIVFFDSAGAQLEGIGSDLIRVHRIDVTKLDPRLAQTQIQVACDVNNPLYGTNGAAYIYGPQKGATPEMIKDLDEGLKNFAKKSHDVLGKDISMQAGAGAAGGLGASLLGYLGASLHSGISIILDYINIEAHIKEADYIFVGEGRLDEQTAMGKAPSGIAQCVQKIKKIPVIALGGGIKGDPKGLHDLGIDAFFSITPAPISLEDALKKENAFTSLRRQSREICHLLKLGLK